MYGDTFSNGDNLSIDFGDFYTAKRGRGVVRAGAGLLDETPFLRAVSHSSELEGINYRVFAGNLQKQN